MRLTKEEIIEKHANERIFDNLMTKTERVVIDKTLAAMQEYADQETLSLRAENERLRKEIFDFLNTIPVDNGNAYLAGFDEHLEKLKQTLNNL